MKTTPETIKRKLLTIIEEMAADPSRFAKNPQKDFTRNRKLDFRTLLLLLLEMGSGTLQTELLHFSRYAVDTPTASAFVQQREKLMPSALEYLLHKFTPSSTMPKRYNGYRLFAVDGADIHTPTNPEENENFFQHYPGEKGYNLLHLNAMYDLCNHMYTDALLQNRRASNEHAALITMVDRSPVSGSVILIADRGYESYNNLAHIEQKGWNYLIRVKDLFNHGILTRSHPPTWPEFDFQVHYVLTRKYTKQMQSDPKYRYMPPTSQFDFFQTPCFPISFRAVRFKISKDRYTTVITNLPEGKFPPDVLKELYHMRWGIETSFRSLKYDMGAICFHSKKTECICQELLAALIMYNFSQWIVSLAAVPRKDTRHVYQINISLAIHICRYFFRSHYPEHPPDIEVLLLAHILPVRKNRCFPRNVRHGHAIGFNYRLT